MEDNGKIWRGRDEVHSLKQGFSFVPASALPATKSFAGSFCETPAPSNFLKEALLIFAFPIFPMDG